jgi:hypothetical protein
VLPDGTRSLIPAAWTNLPGSHGPSKDAPHPRPTVLAELRHLLQARTVIDPLLDRLAVVTPAAVHPRKKGRGKRAATELSRTTVSDNVGPVWDALEETQRAEVIATLARVMAKAIPAATAFHKLENIDERDQQDQR